MKILTLIFILFAGLNGFAQSYQLEIIQAAIVSPHNGEAYFFIDKNKVHQYHPRTFRRSIRTLGSNAFRGVGTDVNAALADKSRGKVFIFKGSTFYEYNMAQGRVANSGTIGRDAFQGLPGGSINGAVHLHLTGNYAFFRLGTVYLYDPNTDKVIYSEDMGKNNLFACIPKYFDAVVRWTDDLYYFFQGEYYYRYNLATKTMENKAVINRDDFENLFPSIDAAFLQKGHPTSKYNGAKGFVGDRYYEAPNESNPIVFKNIFAPLPGFNKSLSRVQKSQYFKNLRFGQGTDKFEDVPTKVDAVIEHAKYPNSVYFLKGDRYYLYNTQTRKVDKRGTLSQGWDGLSSDIDAAFSRKNSHGVSHYFFKDNTYSQYSADSKKIIIRDAEIKLLFPGVPSHLDAAIWSPFSPEEIFFYKRDKEIVFNFGRKQITAINTIRKIAQ